MSFAKNIYSLTTFFALTISCQSEWANWRGPNMDGSSSAKNVPISFSQEKNVRWSIPMPGSAGSTPIISNGKVFVTSTNPQKEDLLALAYDLKSGKQLWSHVVGTGLKQDDRSNYAGASPASDGKNVLFFYGTGDMAVYNHEGKLQWKKNIQDEYGKFYFLWTFSTSPILHEGKIILQILQRDTPVHQAHQGGGKHDSFILALSLSDGKEIYKTSRADEARSESKEAFSTPVLYDLDGKTQLLITGGDCITGHDPETGKELWRWGTWNPGKIGHWRLVPSPVAGKGIALACAPKGAPVYAVKLGKSGTLDNSSISWQSENGSNVSSDVPTPLFYEGFFYVAHNGKKRSHTLSCVEPVSGKVLWSENLGVDGKIEASPTAADGKIYIVTHYGEVVVVASGKKFKKLHHTSMGPGRNGRVRSSIALANGTALIRTDNKLFCLGK
jgi:outer membrane protein assembly factor BamB